MFFVVLSDEKQTLLEAIEADIDFDNVRVEIVYKEDVQRDGAGLPTIARRDEVYESVEQWQQENVA